MENIETISVVVNVDRKQRAAQDAVAELEQVGLDECNVLYNLNVVIGRVALTGSIQETLDEIKEIRGVKEVSTDMSHRDDWII